MTIEKILDDRFFKVATDSKKRLSATASLAWQSEPPQASPAPEDASPVAIPTPKRVRKKGTSQQVIKKEDAIIEKRPISAGSAERNTSGKRLLSQRLPARARNGKFVKQEDLVKQEAINDNEEETDLPDLETILANAGKN
jgi:hypothetical protein